MKPNRSIPIAISSNLAATPSITKVSTAIGSRYSKQPQNVDKIYLKSTAHSQQHQRSPQLNDRSDQINKRTLKSYASPTLVTKQGKPTTKPREYLFGTSSPVSKEKHQNKENEDRFKTITLKDVRRSFREKYLNNEKAEQQKHQPLWFVDVKGNGDYMRSGPNIADRRSQTKSVHDSPSIERDTFYSFRSDNSEPRRSPSLVLDRSPSPHGQSDQANMQRCSSINVINTNGYATYKKKEPRFTATELEQDVWKSSPNVNSPQSSIISRDRLLNREDQLKVIPSINTFNSVPKPAVTISRKNTFKVIRDDDSPERVKPPSTSLKRRDTFVVDIPPTTPSSDSKRGYFLNRYRRLIEPEPEPLVIDRPTKVIPIGVAMPYNHQDDEPYAISVSDRRRRFATAHQSMQEEPNVRDESPPLYASTTYIRSDGSDRQKSPNFRKSPEPRSPSSPSKKPFRSRSTMIQIADSIKKPVESMKISFESLRKPASPKRDPSQTNLGFDRFYDPNYYVPKNQNLFGPLASAQLRTVNVSVQPKISDRSSWLYSKSPK